MLASGWSEAELWANQRRIFRNEEPGPKETAFREFKDLYSMLTPLPSFETLPIPQAVKKPTKKRKAQVRGPQHLTSKEAKAFFAHKKVWLNFDIKKLFVELP